MKRSTYFVPTLRETPAEAQIVSHRLMLRAGMINQLAAGIYNWLPLGVRVLEKIQKIVCDEHDKDGCSRILMPTLQPVELWQESGRYEAYGKELLRMEDRHERGLIYGPTAEEVVTDIFRKYVKSYKELPQVMYQIQWKFRDEIRPRFGVMRGREFLMKDAYSFDIDKKAAYKTYEKMFRIYMRIFNRMGLKVIPIRADSGAIGGDLSHEFQVVAETGESQLYYDAQFEQADHANMNLEQIQSLYAVADDMHNPEDCPVENVKTSRGIEVGHIFYFGKKYSIPMNTTVINQDNKPVNIEGGSYGIGISRVMAALIEANHDDGGIIWPEEVAPFQVGLINCKAGDEQAEQICDDLYEKLMTAGCEVLYDDRKERAGAKFADMDLIGIPTQIIVGKKTLTEGVVELKNRQTGERLDLTLDSALNRIVA